MKWFKVILIYINGGMEQKKLLGKKAYLELEVKVKENWRQDEEILRQMGMVL